MTPSDPLDPPSPPLTPAVPPTPQQIMKDRWMNVGHEDDELKPYMEPVPDYKDPRRTGGAGGWHRVPC